MHKRIDSSPSNNHRMSYDATAKGVTVTVDGAAEHQTIDGFGGIERVPRVPTEGEDDDF